MTIIELDGVLYRVSARTLVAIQHAGPDAGREILVAKGYRVGLPQPFGTLPFAATKPPVEASTQPVASARGRKLTSGRFDTREELLERAWFLKRSTNLSDAAIARNLSISATAVAGIFRSHEGESVDASAAQAAA